MPFLDQNLNNYQLLRSGSVFNGTLQPNVSTLPLLYPVRILCAANTTTRISFPDQYLGRAINLKISNNDGTNAASYRINSSTNVLSNLPASNFRSFSGMNIVSVEVQTGAAGACLISGQMAALPKPAIEGAL